MRAAARSRGRRRHGAIVGVDLGGTTTAAGLVTPDGNVVADASAPTRAGRRDPVETIVELIAEVTERAGRAARAITAIGVGVPGPVDANRERTALLQDAGGDPAGITAATVFAAAQEGDALAGVIVDEACRALGAMMGTRS